MDLAESLYLEHLEESSILYGQWRGRLSSEGTDWRRVIDFEQRLEAHIDALDIGGDRAYELCRVRAGQGDSGEFYAAARVFLRQARVAEIFAMIDALERSDLSRIEAMTDALCAGLPRNDETECLRALLGRGASIPIAIASRVIASRGSDLADRLGECLGGPGLGDDAACSILHALMRAGTKINVERIKGFQEVPDGELRKAAILAVAGTGDPLPLDNRNTPPLCHGLCGGREALSLLLEMAVEEEVVLSMGLLGTPDAVPLLIQHLKHAIHPGAAALGLNLLTGASLYETVFVPEEIDADLLFDHEKEKLKRGEPIWPKGREPGENVTRLSQAWDVWDAWWTDHRGTFDPRRRYRNGVPFSPQCLIDNIGSGSVPPMVRRAAADELAIRYGAYVPFDSRMPVEEQKDALRRYQEWHERYPGRFEAGLWYLNGRAMGDVRAGK